jgi:phenylpropionate dioxygenase-like ring-hydroxylating dioxygenase large terminal subunit
MSSVSKLNRSNIYPPECQDKAMPAKASFDKTQLGKFDSDPARSWTLPGHYYYDADIYQKEMSHIFYRNWQYVCHVSLLQQAGQYFVREIGDQSVFLLKQENGDILGYHNVCQHRAHRLLEAEGKIGSRIVCPYHAWTYAPTGELVFARGSEEMTHFPKCDIQLQPVQVDQICGFIFVNLDAEASSMEQTYPGLEADILALAPEAANLKQAHLQNFRLAANWKNSVENYSECYHCPNRHPSLVESALDINRYKINIHHNYHRHVTSDVGGNQGYSIDPQHQSGDNFGSWLLWPNMVFEVYPGGNLTVFNHVPDGPESCVQETEWYFPNESPNAKEREVIDFVNAVREENIPICESVQRGLHSHGYQQGKFIVDPDRSYVSEHAVHDFQHRVLKAIQK